MAHLIVFTTESFGFVERLDGQRCDRCNRRDVECVRFQTDDYDTLTFCLMSCWPQLVGAVNAGRKLEKPGE